MRWIPFEVVLMASILGFLIVFLSFRNSKNFKWIMVVIIYLTGLGIILFTPISFDGLSIYFMEPGIGRVNKTRLYLHGLGFIENIILTIPLGMILKKFIPQLPFVIVGIIGLIFSSGIEIMQYYLSQSLFINRSSDINDIIANTLGVIVGYFIIMVYRSYKANET